MSNKKISDLTVFTDFDVDDIIPVVDVSDSNPATRTKKYTLAQITQNKAEINDLLPTVDHVYSSNKVQELHNTQAVAIANLATAQCNITQSSIPALTLNTTHTILPFIVNIDSTDNSIMTVDDVNNTITFLKNASFNFLSQVVFSSSTSFARTITFDLVNTSGGTVLVSESNNIDITSGTTEGIALNTLITVGKNGIPPAPLTIRIEAYSTGTGHTIQSFNSILASSSSYDLSSEASGISVVPVGSIASSNVQAALAELDTEKANQSTTYTKTEINNLKNPTQLVTSAGNFTIANYVEYVIIDTALQSTLTITLPTNVNDRQILSMSSIGGITALSFSGGIINGAPTTLASNGYCSFIYNASNTTYYRIG
jgi:hypothetical protein